MRHVLRKDLTTPRTQLFLAPEALDVATKYLTAGWSHGAQCGGFEAHSV